MYSADETFRIIRIIEFNRTEPTCYRTIFQFANSGLRNVACWYIQCSTTRIIYTRGIIQFSNCDGLSRMLQRNEKP